ncbi:MAG: D-alanyl-D-alanine carboxypeptidase, partial [Thermomicrobium sp.]
MTPVFGLLRRFSLAFLLLTLSVTIAGLTLTRYASLGTPLTTPTVGSTPSPVPTPTPAPTPTPIPPPLPPRDSLVNDLTSDRVLLDQHSELPLPPASTLKLLTALTVREILPPEEIVTVQSEDEVDP